MSFRKKSEPAPCCAIYVETAKAGFEENEITTIHSEAISGNGVLFFEDSIVHPHRMEDTIIAGCCIVLEQDSIPKENIVVCTSNHNAAFTMNALIKGTQEANRTSHLRFLNAAKKYSSVQVKENGLLSRHMRDCAKRFARNKAEGRQQIRPVGA